MSMHMYWILNIQIYKYCYYHKWYFDFQIISKQAKNIRIGFYKKKYFINVESTNFSMVQNSCEKSKTNQWEECL